MNVTKHTLVLYFLILISFGKQAVCRQDDQKFHQIYMELAVIESKLSSCSYEEKQFMLNYIIQAQMIFSEIPKKEWKLLRKNNPQGYEYVQKLLKKLDDIKALLQR